MKAQTPAQIGKFWKLFKVAWLKYSQATGEAGEEAREGWRKLHFSDLGFASIHDVDRTLGHDRLMAHFARLAGDDEKALYYEQAVERRLEHLIGETLRKLSHVAGHLFDWSYARGVLHHMHLPENFADVAAPQMFKVFEALDTHLRRMKRKAHPHAPDHHDGHHEHHEEAA